MLSCRHAGCNVAPHPCYHALWNPPVNGVVLDSGFFPPPKDVQLASAKPMTAGDQLVVKAQRWVPWV